MTSAAGALKETVGQHGLVIPGHPHSRPWRDFYVLNARAVLASPEVRKPLERSIRERAKDFTWDGAFEKWQEIVDSLLGGEVVLSSTL